MLGMILIGAIYLLSILFWICLYFAFWRKNTANDDGYHPHDLPDPQPPIIEPTWIDPALWNELGRPRPTSELYYYDGGHYPQ